MEKKKEGGRRTKKKNGEGVGKVKMKNGDVVKI